MNLEEVERLVLKTAILWNKPMPVSVVWREWFPALEGIDFEHGRDAVKLICESGTRVAPSVDEIQKIAIWLESGRYSVSEIVILLGKYRDLEGPLLRLTKAQEEDA